MSAVEAEIEAFFAAFEAASRSEQWHHYEELFLPTFFSLDPGVAAPVDRAALIAFLPQRRGLFARAGATGTRLTGLETLPLDALHVLARTTWDVVHDAPHPPVTLRSSFVLRDGPEGWRIAVYLNHESLLELLGLDPRPAAT